MKKITFSLIVLSFLIGGLSALAQDNDLPSPGLTPDNPFYFLKSWKESIQLFFTFGEENKAKQFLHLSEVRLAEYQKMIEKGKTEIAQKTLEKYEKQLNHALEKADQAQEKGKNVEKLKETISEKILKHQEVLEGVLEKAPEEARLGIEKAIEASQKGFEKSIEAVSGEKKEELEKKAEEIPPTTTEKPIIGQESTEIRYYTCPDGTKVESGKCYGEGEALSCSINMSPDLQCPAPTPPVADRSVCQTAGETKYYQCPSSSQISQVPWCICVLGSVANTWRCAHLPELYCPKPTPISAPTPTEPLSYTSCTKGGMKDHTCSDGTMVRWQCQCFSHNVSISSADYHYDCDLEPAKYCPASNVSTPLTVTKINVRLQEGVKSPSIFWTTNASALSYIEHGSTVSYGFKDNGSPSTPDTNFVVWSLTQNGTSIESKLQPNTVYHFRIVADDTKGNKFVSQDYTFTTE